jgi:hypothetical protein
VLALSIGGVVCIAASNGGTTSQDLKTGFLVGGTPLWQQWAIIIGALTSALVIGGTLLLFNSAGTVYSQRVPPIVIKDQLADLKEMETYNDQQFHVWRPSIEKEYPSAAEPGQTVVVKPGKYLVDAEGRVRYHVDPTITGSLNQRDQFEPNDAIKTRLTPDDLKKIKTWVLLMEENKPNYYRLWTNPKQKDVEKLEQEIQDTQDEKQKKELTKQLQKLEPFKKDVAAGEYLMTGDGAVVFTVTGDPVKMKFEAPKTQVMGIIINGLLNNNLKWSLVLIGGFIAVTLELCGVSALAFAVGVYIPIQYSTPIFVGGMVRWAVEKWTTRKPTGGAAQETEAEQIAKSETSPGVLLASGLIAGGSLAGVLIAFMEFLPDSIKKAMNLEDVGKWLGEPHGWISLVIFGGLVGVLLATGAGFVFKQKNGNGTGTAPTPPA